MSLCTLNSSIVTVDWKHLLPKPKERVDSVISAWTKRFCLMKKIVLTFAVVMLPGRVQSELRLWCYFSFCFSWPYVCCFILLIKSLNEEHYFPSLWAFSKHLGWFFLVFFPLHLCPVLCLWPVLCTVVFLSYHPVPVVILKNTSRKV